MLVRSEKERTKERKIGGIFPNLTYDLCQKGEVCEKGISDPLPERV